jgi:hypothetical protein
MRAAEYRGLAQPRLEDLLATGPQFYGKTKNGGYTCKALPEKGGYRSTKGN